MIQLQHIPSLGHKELTIGTGTKWLLLCKQHFKYIFLKGKFLTSIQLQQVCSWSSHWQLRQHWFQYWHGTKRYQAISWSNVTPDLTRRSENDNTPQPLDQWTNSPFIGQLVGNCKSFTLTHYLADLFAMHRGPRSIPLCIQHHIQLTSLSYQVSRPSHS